jgi:hypothetical protein
MCTALLWNVTQPVVVIFYRRFRTTYALRKKPEERKLLRLLAVMASFIYISQNNLGSNYLSGARGGVVVKALCYKPAGRGFDSRWSHWNFSLIYSFRSHYGLGVDSASNRNEYQVYFLEVKAAGA